MDRLGLIGGTGLVSIVDQNQPLKIYGFELISNEQIKCETPYGAVPLNVQEYSTPLGIKTLVFVQRHHNDGEANRQPHMINHKANIWAILHSKVDALVSVCSVGAIHSSFQPGRIGITKQYIDFTGVAMSFHDSTSKFTSMTTPFDESLNSRLEEHLRSIQGVASDEPLRFTYWLTQGPQFETPAEIQAIETLGGDVVGMTMPREAKLCAEVQLPYAAILISSNWAAGRMPGNEKAQLNHEEVSKEANKHLDTIWSSLAFLMNQ